MMHVVYKSVGILLLWVEVYMVTNQTLESVCHFMTLTEWRTAIKCGIMDSDIFYLLSIFPILMFLLFSKP